MIYFQFFTALISFAREVVKYMNKSEDKKKDLKSKCEKLKTFKTALESGNAKEMENMFAILRPTDGELPKHKR